MAAPHYEIAGNEIESPLVNAAGSINGIDRERILREVDELAGTAIGAITVGSFTVPEQTGNELKFGSPTYYHDRETGKTYNSMGLPNVGLEAAKRLVPEVISRAWNNAKPVVVSVSPTQSSPENGGNAFEQVRQLVEGLLETNADFIEVNTSCPNVVTESGGRKPILGYDLEAMEELLEVLSTSGESHRIGLKLPPYVSKEEKSTVPQLAELFQRYREAFNFLVVSNTIPNQVAQDATGKPVLSVPGGAGGMSGPATREEGREQLRMWKQFVGDIDIISTLGVDSGKELATRRALGAVAAGGVTFLWESTNWAASVSNVLNEFANEEE